MSPVRSDYPLPQHLSEEILADVLIEKAEVIHLPKLRYEARRVAGLIIEALKRRHVGLVIYPKVVTTTGGPVPAERPVMSSRAVRKAAGHAWSSTYQRRQDPLEAFRAAVDATLELQPSWTLEDAFLHTIQFVMPPDYRRKPKGDLL